MYRKIIELDKESYIEIASRVFDKEEKLMIALRGVKDTGEPTVAAVHLDQEEVGDVISALSKWGK